MSVNVVLTDKLGIRNEVQPEYWQRFEDAFALEANTFTEAELKERTGSCRCPLEGVSKLRSLGGLRRTRCSVLTGRSSMRRESVSSSGDRYGPWLSPEQKRRMRINTLYRDCRQD